jgi:hypothetical protein
MALSKPVFHQYAPYLSDLIGLCITPRGLQIEDFVYVTTRENMVAAFHALIETEPHEKLTQGGKIDVRVRGSRKNGRFELRVFSHTTIFHVRLPPAGGSRAGRAPASAGHRGRAEPRNVGMGMPTYGALGTALGATPAPECRHGNADLRMRIP